MSKYDEDRKKIGATGPPGRSKYAEERHAVFNPAPRVDGVGLMMDGMNQVRSGQSPLIPTPPAAQPTPGQEWVKEQSLKRQQNDFFPEPVNRVLSGFAHSLDQLLTNNPIGRGINRFSQGAASAVGVDSQAAGAAPIESTGNKAADFVADIGGNIAGALTNPSNIGQGLVSIPYRVAQQATQRLLPKAPELAKRAAEGGIAGAVQGGVISGVRGETDAGELATNVGIGALTGAVADPAMALIGKGVQRIISKYRPASPVPAAEPTLALPEGRLDSRMRAAQQRGVNTPGTEPITPEYTFQLPEATPRTAGLARNAAEARADLKSIDDEIRQLNQRYEAAVVDEYKFLQESMRTRGGVQQGNVTRDAAGEVTGRYGRQSQNPDWYREFYKANGRAPRNRDLHELARQRVDSGFRDGAADVPGWRQRNGYDEAMGSLQQVRETINTSLRELDPALRVTDSALRSSELGFTPKPRSPRAEVSVAPESAPGPRAAMPEPAAPVRPELPEIPEPGPMAPADTSMGITPTGSSRGKYANPEDTRGYIATKTAREPVDFPHLVDRWYEKTVDNLQQINTFDKTVEQLSGKKLSAADRAYVLGLNSRGSDVTARHILTERLVDAKGNVIGPSLKDITQQIPNGAYDNFNDYLIAKHAETRMARGETVYNRKANMDVTKVAAKIAQYDRTYPQFQAIADQIYAWNANMRQAWLVDTGVIPQAMADAWAEANPYWIPNQRLFSRLEKGGRGSGTKKGFADQKNPVKQYSPTGSERDIIDPFESLIEYTDRYVKTARRNEVMQAIVKSVQRHPDELAGFARILKREKVDPNAAADGLDGLIDSLDDEFARATDRLKKNDLGKDNVVSTLIDGERVYLRVEDPALLDAMTNLSPQSSHAIVEAARKATNAVKLLTTGVNPIFGLTRNIFRDLPEAYIFSKTTDNPFRYAWDALEGFISVFADGATDGIGNSRMLQRVTPESFRAWLDGKAALYKDYKALGGGHSSPAASNRNLLAQTKRDLLPQQRGGVRGAAGRAYGALENLNNALESGPRLGEFKRTRQAGGDTYDSRVAGVAAAQDVTTNFKRSGNWTRDADAFVLYMNAAVQGLDKLARAFKDRPAATALKATGAITMPTIALYAMNHDDPEYQKLSNYNKDNFFLFPTETPGKFIKIPKPRELGVPFGGLMERALRAWADDDPEAFRDFAETAKTMFAPPFVGKLAELENPFRDTIAGPIIDVTSNRNFMDSPIVPRYLEGLSPRHQYDANTSEVSKWIGDKINRSPKQIDHLIRSYTGVLGQLGLPATTQGATVGDTLTKQVTADSAFSSDASKYFYELKDKLDTQYQDAKLTGEVPEGYSDEARKYMARVASELSDITKAIREVDNDKELPRGEKRDLKRELTAERNEIARQVYEQLRDELGLAK